MAQQNLLYNENFELFDICPIEASYPGAPEIEKCLGWRAPTLGTSDFFNACANGLIGANGNVWIPNNFAGIQNTLNGNGYVGLFAGNYGFTYFPCDDGDSSKHYREYIQAKLIHPLQSGTLYKLTFHISLAENVSGYAVKNIGALLTTDAIGFNCFKPIVANPQVKSPDFVADTITWTKVEGEFIAQGGEEFLTIGNFADTVLFFADTLCIKPMTDWQNGDGISYYYIDGLELIEVGLNYIVPNIFTPNNDGDNDFLTLNFPYDKFTVMNRWGNIVFESNTQNVFWNGKDQNGVLCNDGIYFYVIESNKINKTGYIQLLK